MSQDTMDFGEPESSQNTPLRNTIPLKRKADNDAHMKVLQQLQSLDEESEAAKQRSHALVREYAEFNSVSGELDDSLKETDDLIESNAPETPEKPHEIQNLTAQASRATRRSTEQYSTAARKDEHIRRLESDSKRSKATIRRLRSAVALKDSELKMNISLIKSQEEDIRKLEKANQSSLDQKTETSVETTQLAAEVSKLRLDLDSRSRELKSQVTLLNQRNDTIRCLEATNMSLSEVESQAINEVEVLEAQLSKLDSDLKRTDDEICSHRAESLVKNGQIERLEEFRAGLLKELGEAKDDKEGLRILVRDANTREGKLEAELKSRTKRLCSADEEIVKLKRGLEQVGKDLLAEKKANRTASLEVSLAAANDQVEKLSKDLRNEIERLQKETSNKNLLFARNMSLERENENLSEDKGELDKIKTRLEGLLLQRQATIQDLQSDVGSKSALLDQLHTQRTVYNTERDYLLRLLITESRRVHSATQEQPNNVGNISGELHDFRILSGDLEGGRVLLRVQRCLRSRMLFIILEKQDHTTVVWHESNDKCRLHLRQGEWYIRLERGPSEPSIEVCIDDAEPYNLKAWLGEGSV